MGSDHNPLMIKVNIKLKKPRKKHMNLRGNRSRFRSRSSNAYMADTENKYDASCKESYPKNDIVKKNPG